MQFDRNKCSYKMLSAARQKANWKVQKSFKQNINSAGRLNRLNVFVIAIQEQFVVRSTMDGGIVIAK